MAERFVTKRLDGLVDEPDRVLLAPSPMMRWRPSS